MIFVFLTQFTLFQVLLRYENFNKNLQFLLWLWCKWIISGNRSDFWALASKVSHTQQWWQLDLNVTWKATYEKTWMVRSVVEVLELESIMCIWIQDSSFQFWLEAKIAGPVPQFCLHDVGRVKQFHQAWISDLPAEKVEEKTPFFLFLYAVRPTNNYCHFLCHFVIHLVPAPDL